MLNRNTRSLLQSRQRPGQDYRKASSQGVQHILQAHSPWHWLNEWEWIGMRCVTIYAYFALKYCNLYRPFCFRTWRPSTGSVESNPWVFTVQDETTTPQYVIIHQWYIRKPASVEKSTFWNNSNECCYLRIHRSSWNLDTAPSPWKNLALNIHWHPCECFNWFI